jgi:hypothetical protein
MPRRKPRFENQDSSLITQLACTLGYLTQEKLEPKALLLSTRRAPVRKRRSPKLSCSCA